LARLPQHLRRHIITTTTVTVTIITTTTVIAGGIIIVATVVGGIEIIGSRERQKTAHIAAFSFSSEPE
jgi:hypothetical protein